MKTGTVADAPASSAPTSALPETEPPTPTSTVVAAEGADLMLRTVAWTVTASRSLGCAGSHVRADTVRSGLGAAVPLTWNSAIWAPYPEVLEWIFSCRSA